MTPSLTWEDVWSTLFWQDSAPTPMQQEIIDCFAAGNRRIMISGGERAGKSRVAAYIAGLRMGPASLTDKSKWGEVKRFWLVGSTYLSGRVEFSYLRDAMMQGGFIESESMPQAPNMPWTFTTIWGTVVETRTSYDAARLASYSIHGALMCEAGAQDMDILSKLYGRVSETRGWVLLVGTFEDNYPWYEALWRKWQGPNPDDGKSFSLPSWSNIAVYPGGEHDPEIELLRRSVTEDWFMRRYAAKPVRPSELVIPEFDFATHVMRLEPVDGVPVQLAIDPGKNAYAVLFVQHIGAYTYVLDAVYTRGEIAQAVIPKVMANPLWPRVDRAPGMNIIDIAGTQEHGNDSQVKLWRNIANIQLGYKLCPMRDTIDTVRFRLRPDPVLGQPLTVFSDKLKTGIAPDGTAREFLSEFDLWKWPKAQMGANERAVPIDANNHGIKALGYKLINYYGVERERRVTRSVRARRNGFSNTRPQGPVVVAQPDGLNFVAQEKRLLYNKRKSWLAR